jgi:hypothetical protein
MSHRRRNGKSVEEVIVRRKFDSTDPGTWPDPLKNISHSKFAQTLPNLQAVNATSIKVDTNAALVGYSDEDKNEIMNSLMNYCSALQKRIQVVLFIFNIFMKLAVNLSFCGRIWKHARCHIPISYVPLLAEASTCPL